MADFCSHDCGIFVNSSQAMRFERGSEVEAPQRNQFEAGFQSP
jgi:hypothetical protein